MLHCLFWALIKHRQQHITNRFTALLYQQHYSTNNHNSSASTALQHTPITCKTMWETNHHQGQHRITPCIIRNKSASNTTHSAQQSIIINTNTVRNQSASTTKDTTQQTSIKYKAQRATQHQEIRITVRINSLSILIESQLAASAIPLFPVLAHIISIAFLCSITISYYRQCSMNTYYQSTHLLPASHSMQQIITNSPCSLLSLFAAFNACSLRLAAFILIVRSAHAASTQHPERSAFQSWTTHCWWILR